MADPARSRFFLISTVRLAGALMILIGLIIAYGRWDGLPQAAGIIVTLTGAFGFAIAPRLLARRWRSLE
jgi:uncharacterized membrane protein